MRKLTQREVKRLLAIRGTPEPPPGLADHIKAEIPEVLQLGGAAPKPAGVRGMPARTPALRPLWLLAASLLVVIGAGFVAVRFFAPTSDFAREIALGGVVRIEDIVVTVPERSTVERQQTAAATTVEQHADKETPVGVPPSSEVRAKRAAASAGVRPGQLKGPSEQSGALAVTVRGGKEPLSGVTITATAADAAGAAPQTAESGKDGHAEIAPLPPGDYTVRAERKGFEARETRVRVAAGVEDRVNVAMKQEPVEKASQRAAAPVAATDRAAASAPPAPVTNGSILVTVRDADGNPVPGATVLLAFSDRPDVGCGFRVTGNAGVATFCCVAPGTYRICTQRPGFVAAAQDRLAVAAGRPVEVRVQMERQPGDEAAAPWTCPTPRPAVRP